ncbi:hypothetical protein P872_10440 [Rhodonellum psychrophilum GCM71 = DSM 17998]|uniref:Uncharacterized protein n=1 Tax=Rhodonellum psychrophilum GCM71 = DSM 17998 TaxID=1123057 RepID=U5BV34_9BACT|nr:hypothetical protein P872_10440 [Rhodonellum psychrophilum GCM71 = DSM 17998]
MAGKFKTSHDYYFFYHFNPKTKLSSIKRVIS